MTPVEAWKNLIKKLQSFRQQKDMSNRSAWPEADAIRAIARTGPTADIPKFPRAAFGLPVIFHFTGKNAPAGNYTFNEADTGQSLNLEHILTRNVLPAPSFCDRSCVRWNGGGTSPAARRVAC